MENKVSSPLSRMTDMHIKRYNIFVDDFGCLESVVERDGGEWVVFEDVERLVSRIKELEDGSCRFNCRKVGKLHKIIDRIEKYTEKTPHAPKHRLVLSSDLQDLIRERKGEVKD